MNVELDRAMRDKGIGAARLAELVGVSDLTARRWVSNEQMRPQPRTAHRAAEVLEVPVASLWPSRMRQAVKVGPEREIVSAYPYRSSCPSPVWARLISEASENLFFGGYTNYFIFTEQPNMRGQLRKKVQEGCRVRFLLGDPEGDATGRREEVERVALTLGTRIRITLDETAEIPGAEVRFSAADDASHHVSLSVFRFDDQALVTPHLARAVGHDSPMLHLRRMQSDGMFDRFVRSAEELWDRGVPVDQE